MQNRPSVRLMLILAAWSSLLWFILYASSLLRTQLRTAQEEPQRENGGGVSWKGTYRKSVIPEKTDIFFLKTHKCGTSTVQNILMRFGSFRDLDFVLPSSGNHLRPGLPFKRDSIAPEIMAPNRTFNIFAHHTIYHHDEVKAVMKPDAAFVTILREPSDVFESIYGYYGFVKVTRKTLKQLMSSPKYWPEVRQMTNRKIGTNQMSFDLGFDTANVSKTRDMREIKRFIRKIDEEFDLVMITEYMEASLVLLCDLMNWPLENVVYFRLNERTTERKVELNLSERYMLLKMNPVDSQLYAHFLEKFRSLVINYGPEKMKTQVDRLLRLNSDLRRNCAADISRTGCGGTLEHIVRNERGVLCQYAVMDELKFTQEIRDNQFRRFSVMQELDELMAGTTEA